MSILTKAKLKNLLHSWAFWTVAVRFLVWLVFAIAGLYFLHVILFPSRTFEYFFDTPSALKNTVADPRIEERDLSKGALSADKPLLFNTNLIGTYSHTEINLTLAKKSVVPKDITINLRKSYRAFFLPEGDPIGFSEGALISNDGNYYIVSDSKLRPFSSSKQAETMGFSIKSFLSADIDSISSMQIGSAVDGNDFPEGALIQVNENYYQLKNGMMFPFLSEAAFRSNFDPAWAAIKDASFLKNYTVSETPIGFRDGTLASSNESVFILSAGKRYPIDNVETFTAMGYSWDDLVAVTAEELGLYEKQKLFTQDSPHPDGTVFVDRNSGDYYMTNKGKRSPFVSKLAAQMYLRGSSAVMVDSRSLEKSLGCKMQKNFALFSANFSCRIPLAELENYPGNDFEFSMESDKDLKAQYLNVTFKKVVGSKNLFSSLAQIKGNIKKNYYGIQQ